MTVENEPLLSVRNLHTYFAQDEGMVKAVDGVSLEMSAGATLGVVGESGCGKSVTARSILRIVDRPGRIVAGEIWFRRPTANGGAGGPALDVTTQTQILELLRQLQQEDGMAIMLITHDLGVIAEMATDVAVMYLGRVVEQAPVDAIFHAPKHPYTRALLRSIPRMRARSRERLTPIAGSVPHPYDRPSGCPFHPRCPEFIAGTCDRETPTLRPVGDRHAVSCWLYR